MAGLATRQQERQAHLRGHPQKAEREETDTIRETVAMEASEAQMLRAARGVTVDPTVE